MKPAASPWSPQQLDALNRLTTVARLLSTAVHETGNALQVISGNAEMIAARPEDSAKAGERAQRIKVHADQVGARLQSLAALATAETSAPRRLDLRPLCERVVALRRYSLNRAQIAVVVDGLPNAPVLGNEGELIRLIANLLLNAERAVRDRPAPDIRLDVARTGERIRLSVTDNGAGIPAADAESIFQPFATGRPPGCGLAVSRWIAEKHGGTLRLDRDYGPGAKLVLELPETHA